MTAFVNSSDSEARMALVSDIIADIMSEIIKIPLGPVILEVSTLILSYLCMNVSPHARLTTYPIQFSTKLNTLKAVAASDP